MARQVYARRSGKALALISVAVANSPAYERVWIEDIYQNIYCGAAHGIRKQATGIVADWRTRYGRKPDYAGRLRPRRAQHAGDAYVRQRRAGAVRDDRNGRSTSTAAAAPATPLRPRLRLRRLPCAPDRMLARPS